MTAAQDTQSQERQRLIQARANTAEYQRLQADTNGSQAWKRWGPYVSDRHWGTVREDYSAGGAAWDFFPHDHARSRAYRWGEDGIAGISDDKQRLCFGLTLWNGEDDILKERLYGLTGGSGEPGNHGEDVKEYYFYLDNTPTHSYMECLYKYPQSKFPYGDLNNVNRTLGRNVGEYELLDTGIFEDNRYYDVFVEYAKQSVEDILIQFRVVNRGPEAATLHLLPKLWFRNTWSWGLPGEVKPSLQATSSPDATVGVIEADFKRDGYEKKWLYCDAPNALLFTENETNSERFEWGDNASAYVKDGINNYIVNGQTDAVNPARVGTKASAHYVLTIGPGETAVVRLRLSDQASLAQPFDSRFDGVFTTRKAEADDFYQAVTPFNLAEDMRRVQRQAFAGMLWTKQFYYYVVHDWLEGDPIGPAPPPERSRNREWTHLYNEDIISMPDKWEYPWFAAWDLAFHTVALALIDPAFAKDQLRLFTREWYMHPNGQIPAYEWAFGDVNPPVHAWATYRVYKIEEKMYGGRDREFLDELFQKLSLYFTWWANQKDENGNNLFSGGFLGLDNIGPIDRSHLPGGTNMEQSDGTAWMAMYCLNMLKIANELTKEEPEYLAMTSKFFQHFLLIAEAMNQMGDGKVNIWDDENKFYRDILQVGARYIPINVWSMVGLIPLYAVDSIPPELVQAFNEYEYNDRYQWFIRNRPDLTSHSNIALEMNNNSESADRVGAFVALVDPDTRLRPILERMLDEAQFLSPHGIRGLSKEYENNPYEVIANGRVMGSVDYQPAESTTSLFGGNSNWRGPVWFPVNFLLIESLQKFHYYLGDSFTVEFPTGSGVQKNLWEVSQELSLRLIQIFLKNDQGQRPVYGGDTTIFDATNKFQTDPAWQDHILFYEYFHGDNGAGIGASHQTGWTGLVAKLIQQYGEYSL